MPTRTAVLRSPSRLAGFIVASLAAAACGSTALGPTLSALGDAAVPPAPDAGSTSGQDNDAAGSATGSDSPDAPATNADGSTVQVDAASDGSRAGDAGTEAGSPAASDGGGALASRPLMGWSSWSTFEDGVNETIVKAVADAIATQLLPSGYEYINIDDGWYNGFDAYGRRQPDTSKFPGGISGLATYVHGKGLKLGIYLLPGLNDTVYAANSPIYGTSYHAQDIVSNPSLSGNTDRAAGQTAKQIDYSRPGAVEYVESYANLLASWGVDYVKMDFVGPGGGGGHANNETDIQQWRAALDRTGRQIWLELSNKLDLSAIATWKAYSNGWRIQTDVECYCSTLTNWAHVVRNITSLAPWVPYAGPGHWNDLDSMEIGNGSHDGITTDERQTMFSFWSLSAAPISLGSDPRSLDPTDLAILTNQEVIAVDQAGVAAIPLSTATNQQVWYAKNADGSFTVGLFNLDSAAASVTVNWSDIGAGNTVNVRDLVSGTNLGATTSSFTAHLATHASRLLRLAP